MDSNENQSGTKTCVACDGEISSKAVKCPRCGTFQNWRRLITVNTTVLSLLIALLSVSALVGPTLRDIFFEGASLRVELDHRDISYRGNSGGRPGEYHSGLAWLEIEGTLIISNSGNRSAYLKSVVIHLQIASGPSNLRIGRESVTLPFNRTIKAQVESPVDIAPGDLYFADFKVFDSLQAYYPLTDEEYEAEKRIPIDFTGTQIVVELVRHDLNKESISLPLEFHWEPS
ncbi:MAG: hypothetical protein O7F71_12490 [Gammaproteobacteria bacterium]|nr:hypothetical protein [Gammaproteobacteria bacterium]